LYKIVHFVLSNSNPLRSNLNTNKNNSDEIVRLAWVLLHHFKEHRQIFPPAAHSRLSILFSPGKDFPLKIFWGIKVNHFFTSIQKNRDISSGFFNLNSLLHQTGILSLFTPSINSMPSKRVQIYYKIFYSPNNLFCFLWYPIKIIISEVPSKSLTIMISTM